jgi:hypothetical protein
MLRILKITLIILIVVGCTSIAALPSIVSSSYVKRYIEKQLSTELKQTVKLTDAPSLALGDPIVLKLEGISVTGLPETKDKNSIKSKSFTATVAPFALLGGKFKVNTLEVSDALLNITDSLPLAIKTLVAKNVTHGTIKIASTLELASQPIEVKIKLAALDEILGKNDLPITFELSSGEHQISGSGSITYGQEPVLFNLSAAAEGPDATFFSSFVDSLELPKVAYALKLDVARRSPGEMAINIHNLDLGENNLSGNLKTTEKGEKRVFSGSILSKNLSFPLEMAPSDRAVVASNSDESSNELNDGLSNVFEPIKNLAGKLAVKIENFRYAKHQLQNIDGSIEIQENLISVPSLLLTTYGGKLSAKAMLTPSSLKLLAKGNGINFGEIGDEGLIEGKGTAIIDIVSKGNNWKDIANNIKGTAEFLSPGGKLNSGSALIASSGLHEILPKLFGKETKAELSCMIGRFAISKSVATFKDYVLKIGKVSVFAKGWLDFPESKISANFYTRSAVPALASLVPPFKMLGNLYDPTVLPNPLGVIVDVADSVQGLTQSVGGTIGGATSMAQNIVTGKDSAKVKLAGIALCEKELEVDKFMLTSQLGGMLEASPDNEAEKLQDVIQNNPLEG